LLIDDTDEMTVSIDEDGLDIEGLTPEELDRLIAEEDAARAERATWTEAQWLAYESSGEVDAQTVEEWAYDSLRYNYISEDGTHYAARDYSGERALRHFARRLNRLYWLGRISRGERAWLLAYLRYFWTPTEEERAEMLRDI
jgi:hypothetical protein